MLLFFLIAFSYSNGLFNLLIVYVLPFLIYRSFLFCGSGRFSLYTANDICPSGEAFSVFQSEYTALCRCSSLYIFSCCFFQKEYSLFLSVEEYQIPEIRSGLFDEYLQQYLGYSEKQVLNVVDEKVSIST